MGVDKVILRAFLSTLAAIAVLLVFMFSMLALAYPQTMMELTYNVGMEASSIHFAEQSYKRSDEVYYIAYATEVAIGEGNNDKIISCGGKLIADVGFDAYCAKRDAEINEGKAEAERIQTSYKQYIYGQYCVAMYRKGDVQRAVARAFELVGKEFPYNNAVVALAVTAKAGSDTATLDMIKGKMNTLQGELDDTAYLETVLTLLEK
ncbi:MAG: hypothetical protein IJX30_06795 [Clostridia bacterium]|nr:hypothetical protein [Clostridia bacterium]